MSTAVEKQVYEAELVETADNFNPYQAPNSTQRPAAISISRGFGPGRATQRQIDNARRSMIAAEISFFIACVVQLAALMTGFEHQALSDLFFGSALAAWFCFAWMVLSCDDVDLVSIAAVVLYPIPIFGSLLFFLFKQRANRFMIWNGYRPGLVGATMDSEEIRLMNEDCNYRPAAKYHVDGSKRRIAWSLSDWFFVVGICTVVFAIVIPWTLF